MEDIVFVEDDTPKNLKKRKPEPKGQKVKKKKKSEPESKKRKTHPKIKKSSKKQKVEGVKSRGKKRTKKPPEDKTLGVDEEDFPSPSKQGKFLSSHIHILRCKFAPKDGVYFHQRGLWRNVWLWVSILELVI
jgi:hypothetical protein